jgi:hypothetical protein
MALPLQVSNEIVMNNDIPLKYYDIADEYATEAAEQVAESELDALAHYISSCCSPVYQITRRSARKPSRRWPLRPGSVLPH